MPKKLAIITSIGEERPLLRAPEGSTEFEAFRVELRIPGFARNPYDRFLVDLAHVDAGERAVAEGADAIFLDTFADYGIAPLRHAVHIPVIGAGEAGIITASAGGTRDFAIVTVWPQLMHFLYEERLGNVPGGERCKRVEHVLPEIELAKAGTDAFIKNRMVRHEEAVIEMLAAAVQRVADEEGVDTILLGCTCMAPVGPQIQERVTCTVVEGQRNGLAACWETLRAPQGEVMLSPRRGTVPLILDGYLANGVLPAFEADACEVCVSLASEEEIAASLA